MAGPFRVRSTSTTGYSTSEAQYGADTPSASEPVASQYAKRLLKLVPAESLAFYLAGSALVPASADLVASIWFGIGILATIVVRLGLTQDREHGKGPQYGAVTLSTVSFAIWAYSMARPPFREVYEAAPYVSSLIVLTWTFFVPYVYRGDIDR